MIDKKLFKIGIAIGFIVGVLSFHVPAEKTSIHKSNLEKQIEQALDGGEFDSYCDNLIEENTTNKSIDLTKVDPLILGNVVDRINSNYKKWCNYRVMVTGSVKQVTVGNRVLYEVVMPYSSNKGFELDLESFKKDEIERAIEAETATISGDFSTYRDGRKQSLFSILKNVELYTDFDNKK